MRRLVIDSTHPIDAALAERLSDCGCRVVTAIGAASLPESHSVPGPGIFVAMSEARGALVEATNASFSAMLGFAHDSIAGTPIEAVLQSRAECPSARALVEAISACQPYVGSAIVSDAHGASHLIVARVFPLTADKCVGIVEWVHAPIHSADAPSRGTGDRSRPNREDALRRNGVTPRERQIVEGIAGRGVSIKALAFELSISPHTVRNHLRSIYSKLDIGSQVELVRWYTSRRS